VKISRRQFLTSAATLSVAGALAPYAKVAKLSQTRDLDSKIIRAGHFKFEPNQTALEYYSADDFKHKTVFEWNFKTGAVEHFDTSTVVHVVETHPVDSRLTALGTKRTNQISLVDWKSKREVTKSRFGKNQYYYGHAVFTDDGKHIITSSYVRGAASQICILEVPSLKIVDSVTLPRSIAHEIVNMGNNRFLFGIGAENEHPVAFGIFDFTTKEIQFFDTEFGVGEPEMAITHLKDCGDRYIANVNLWSNLSDGALVSFDPKTNQVKTEITLGAEGLHSEMLSFEFDPTTHHAWITLPRQNEIKIWNLATDSLVKTLEFKRDQSPTAVSYIPQLSLALVTTPSRFLAFDSNTLRRRVEFESKVPNSLLFGGFTAHTRLV
jgi:hypothetical protein